MNEPKLFVLTLWQPWAWAIAYRGKRIENRTWHPPARSIGQRIAIHAGKRYDREGERWMVRKGLAATGDFTEAAHVHSAIVAVATLGGIVHTSDDPWFMGPVGWLLRDVVALPHHLGCSGKLGLWPVPDGLRKMIVSALAKTDEPEIDPAEEIEVAIESGAFAPSDWW